MRLVQDRGKNHEGVQQTRELVGTVRMFKQEGEQRYELVIKPPDEVPCGTCGGSGKHLVNGVAVGFTPTGLLSAEDA